MRNIGNVGSTEPSRRVSYRASGRPDPPRVAGSHDPLPTAGGPATARAGPQDHLAQVADRRTLSDHHGVVAELSALG